MRPNQVVGRLFHKDRIARLGEDGGGQVDSLGCAGGEKERSRIYRQIFIGVLGRQEIRQPFQKRPESLNGAILQRHGGLLAEHTLAGDLQGFRRVQVWGRVSPSEVQNAFRYGDEEGGESGGDG